MPESLQQSSRNQETVTEYIDVAFGNAASDRLDDLVVADYVDHMKELQGRDALRDHLVERQEMASKMSISADVTIATDEYVAVHWVSTDPDDGPEADSEPMGMELYRMDDGKIAECWTSWGQQG